MVKESVYEQKEDTVSLHSDKAEFMNEEDAEKNY